MEVTVGSPADNSNRKRKFQTELMGPFPKHVRCVDEGVEYNLLPDLSKELPVYIKIFTRGSDSDPESVKDSNSIHADADSYMSEHDEAKIDVENPKSYASDEPCTSTSKWNGAPSGTYLYSLESRSLTTSSCSKSESVSISEEHDYKFLPYLNYEENLTEFGTHDDCCSSGYINDDVVYSVDKDLENLLGSSGVSSSDYVLSSGRWSVNQDTEQSAVKLTIDKEFEQYFSTLML